jgi:signal transduction histidine kinase
LILGGVLALPYALLAAAFAQAWTLPDTDRELTALLAIIAAAIAVVPAFLPATRTVEIVVVRGLLGVNIPEPGHGQISREARLRSALWFAMHLVIGGLVVIALAFTIPMALVFVAQQLGIGTADVIEVGPLDSSDTVWWTVIGFAMLVALAYAVSALGALAAAVAPTLLGPSPEERIAALEAQTTELAARNRLARELHDSVGHALTVTTLQAAAARQVLDTDPEFVRNALVAVEEAGRSAMEDLDHVLGLLRERETQQTMPQRTLSDLDRLVSDAQAAGVRVNLDVDGNLSKLPSPVSREGYRILQESLTNVVRHSQERQADVRVSVGDALGLEVSNPLARPLDSADGDVAAEQTGRRNGGGRGLSGMRERVAIFGGTMTAGPQAGRWLVDVRLPVKRKGGR